MLKKLDSCLAKDETNHYMTPYTEINSKWITGMDIKSEIIKYVETIKQNALQLKFRDIFVNSSPKGREKKKI